LVVFDVSMERVDDATTHLYQERREDRCVYATRRSTQLVTEFVESGPDIVDLDSRQLAAEGLH
jgi:hypothetical protein